MKVYVLMENDYPVGVSHSKTQAEGWMYDAANDYLTFDDGEVKEKNQVEKADPVERNSVPAQNLNRNLDRLDKNIGDANKELGGQLDKLKKRFAPKSKLLKKSYL